MATYTIYITLLSALLVLHLPCPLIAKETDKLIVDEIRLQRCYERCVGEGRFPCLEGSSKCGDCIVPLTSYQDGECKVKKLNAGVKQKILQFIDKRDEGSRGVELDTGVVQDPPPAPPAPDVQNPPPAGQEGQPRMGDEENQAIPDADGAGENLDLDDRDESLEELLESNAQVKAQEAERNNGSVILLEEWQFILIVVGCVAVAIIGVAVAFVCWYKIQTTSKAQNEADYPAYGVTGPGTQLGSSMNNGDRKLAQSAQMYHYQHQKQQMIAMEKREKGDVARDASDYDSEEENEDGDLTVYECPGLAPTGEMQVKNPLFAEDAYPKPGAEEEDQQKQ